MMRTELFRSLQNVILPFCQMPEKCPHVEMRKCQSRTLSGLEGAPDDLGAFPALFSLLVDV